MKTTNPRIWLVALTVIVGAATGCPGRTPAPDPSGPAPSRTDGGAASTAEFEARVRDYVRLHRELEATLPKLHAEASPEEIDRNQRALAALLRSARPDAKPGELFTREMQDHLARVIERLAAGRDGKNLVGSIMDENPGVPGLAVNARYPEGVPLSTMPPQLLRVLPELEEDLEFRFVGRRLVLLDTHAYMIVDFTDELLPV